MLKKIILPFLYFILTFTLYAEALQTVVAEGRGTDEVSALRNAFQDAVGQVVGLVVDSQTLIKNDAVIQDRILTASNGFISSFEKLTSKAEVGGVWLVKIRAVVERKSLIKKLEAERVTISKPSTSNLFAEVASDMMAVEGSTKLLSERLSEIQNSWSATAGKPSYDRVSGELSVPITIMVDSAAYAVSSKRLVELLDKIALSKKRKVLSGIPCKEKDGIPTPGRFLANFSSNQKQREKAKSFQGMAASSAYGRQQWKGYAVTDWLLAEDYDKLPPHAFWVWICVSKRASHTEWLGYAVDVDMAKVAPMLCPVWSLTASLKDGSGRVTNHWEDETLTFKSHAFISCNPEIAKGEGCAQPGYLPHWVSMGNTRYARRGSGMRRPWVAVNAHRRGDVTKSSWSDHNNEINRQRLLIAPLFLSLTSGFHQHMTDGALSYWSKETITSSFKMSPDSILKVKDIEVKFQPRKWSLTK